MQCGIAEAYYKGVPVYIAKRVKEILTEDMKTILERFYLEVKK